MQRDLQVPDRSQQWKLMFSKAVEREQNTSRNRLGEQVDSWRQYRLAHLVHPEMTNNSFKLKQNLLTPWIGLHLYWIHRALAEISNQQDAL
jgi:hypothetical protein